MLSAYSDDLARHKLNPDHLAVKKGCAESLKGVVKRFENGDMTEVFLAQDQSLFRANPKFGTQNDIPYSFSYTSTMPSSSLNNNAINHDVLECIIFDNRKYSLSLIKARYLAALKDKGVVPVSMGIQNGCTQSSEELVFDGKGFVFSPDFLPLRLKTRAINDVNAFAQSIRPSM